MDSPQLLALIDMQDVFNTTQGTQDVLYSDCISRSFWI